MQVYARLDELETIKYRNLDGWTEADISEPWIGNPPPDVEAPPVCGMCSHFREHRGGGGYWGECSHPTRKGTIGGECVSNSPAHNCQEFDPNCPF